MTFFSRQAMRKTAILASGLASLVIMSSAACNRTQKATAEEDNGTEEATFDVPPPAKDAAERLAYVAAAQSAADPTGVATSEGGKLAFTNVGYGLVGDVTDGKINVRSAGGRTKWGVALKALRYGYTGALKAVPAAVDSHATGNKIELKHGPIAESVVSGGLGVQYMLTVNADPAGRSADSRMLLVLSLQGDLKPGLASDSRSIEFRDGSGEVALRARDVLASSGGKPIPVGLTLARDEILVAVSTKDASFPISMSFMLTPESTVAAIDAIGDSGFGEAVGCSGSSAIVGAPAKAVAYVLGRTQSGWKQKSRLSAKSAGQASDFGQAVAISGANAVVGAPRENPDKGGYRGAVHLFTATGDNWSEGAKLQPSEPTDMLGTTVAIDDEVILVGAPGSAGGSAAGAAYLFGKDKTGAWAEVAKLKGGAGSKRFGRAVALGTNAAYVAAEGAVHVFAKKGNTWTEKMKLTPSENEPDFGSSLAAAHDGLYVGSPTKGVVYAYSGTSGAMTAHGTIAPRTPTKGFGSAIAANGTAVLVGSPTLSIANTQAGGVTAFTRRGQAWGEAALLVPIDPVSGESFGSSLAMSGEAAIVGTRIVSKCPPDCTPTTGRAYSFLRLPAKPDAAKCGDDSECTSGVCADGVCCNERCDGPCDSCLAANKHGGGDGECGPATAGTDPRGRCQAEPDHISKCKADGMCDGAGKCRTIAPAGALCSAQVCQGGVTRRGTCEGTAANCKMSVAGCAPYTCSSNGVECRSSCVQDSECASGFTCTAGACKRK